MSDEDLPGDETPTAAAEVPASDEAPAPDAVPPAAAAVLFGGKVLSFKQLMIIFSYVKAA